MRRSLYKFYIAAASLVAVVAVLFSGAFTAVGERSDANAEAVFQPVAINEKYDYGSEFTVPEREVTYNGNSVKADSVVRLPDGTVTTKKTIVLSQSGVYKVNYTAKLDGKVFVAEESFTVTDNLFNLTDGASSAVYGTHKFGGTTKGLVVRLAENDSLTFTKLIDMSSLDKNKTLIRAFVTPDEIRTLDFNKLVFKFTDSLDPSVYLIMWAMQSGEGVNKSATYYSAGGQNQPVCGLEGDKLHINDGYGPATVHSFYGNYGGDTMPPDLSKNRMILSYDSESNSVYCGRSSAGETFVIDLDSYDYFNNMWTGFPSGKAYLSVSATGYTGGNTANFVLTDVRGIDLKDEFFFGGGAPVITVDNDYGTMPEARAGGSYPVPKATAFDDYDGSVRVSVNAYYNYNTPTPINITIENGRFETARRGYYAIVYEARNRHDKLAREILWVHAGGSIPELEVNIDESDGNFGKSAELGRLVMPAVCYPTGGSGELTVSVSATNGSVTLDAENGFIPETSGKWTVTYTVTDYIGTVATDSYDIDAAAGDTAVFVDKPVLPKYLISGSEYRFPVLYANDYRSGSVEKIAASFTVTDSEGSTDYAAGAKFTPVVDDNLSDVVITFRAAGATAEYTLKCVRAFVTEEGRARLHAENYFDSAGTRIVKTNDYIRVDATANNSGWTFANALVAESFTMTFSFVPSARDMDGLKFVMTDAEDPSVTLESRIVTLNGKTYFQAGGKSTLVDMSFSSSDRLTLSYKNGSISLGVNEIALENFGGFPSHKMYLSTEFIAPLANNASYRIYNLNGQEMNNSTLDLGAPKIVVLGDYGGTVSIGSFVTLPAAVAGDVYDPNISFGFTVTAPDGSIVSDVNGTRLQNADPTVEYTIYIGDYGQYQVNYTAVDTFRNNRQPLPYALSVYDEVAPEVSVSGTVTSAQAGDVIALPRISVSDNVSAAENITVSVAVLNPDGQLVWIPANKNAYKVTTAGVYEIRIYVADEAGNVTMLRLNVDVE